MDKGKANDLFDHNIEQLAKMDPAPCAIAKQWMMTLERNDVFVRLRDAEKKRVYYEVVEGDAARTQQVAEQIGITWTDKYVEAT